VFCQVVASFVCADCYTKFDAAQAAYRRVLDRDPNHAKVLQQLGWLYHQQSNSYSSQEKAIEYLEKSVSAGM
jgi:general transcriptional corepressor CYC8